MTTYYGRAITTAIANKMNKILRAIDPNIGTYFKWSQDNVKRLAVGKYDFTVNSTTFTFLPAAVSAANDTITKAGHGLVTGDTVLLTTTTTLPAGLSLGTAYYVIVVDASTIKLASSRANAFAGTVVDITGIGVGTHTVTSNVFGDVNLLLSGVVLPNAALVVRTYYMVYTSFTSPTGPNNATIALTLNGANDIVTATAIKTSGVIWNAGGVVAGAQDNAVGNVLALTADRELLMQVGVEGITAGKIKVFVEYIDTA